MRKGASPQTMAECDCPIPLTCMYEGCVAERLNKLPRIMLQVGMDLPRARRGVSVSWGKVTPGEYSKGMPAYRHKAGAYFITKEELAELWWAVRHVARHIIRISWR